jgi:hypothetical protein
VIIVLAVAFEQQFLARLSDRIPFRTMLCRWLQTLGTSNGNGRLKEFLKVRCGF